MRRRSLATFLIVASLGVIASPCRGQEIIGWGRSDTGQLDYPSDSDIVSVSAGSAYGLAIKRNGSIKGWGRNVYGETQAPSGSYVSVSAGFTHSVAITSNGTLVDFGWFAATDNTPTGEGFVDISASPGSSHSFAVRVDGYLFGWGAIASQNVPPVQPVFEKVAASTDFAVALRKDGSLESWGVANIPGMPAGTGFADVGAGANFAIALKGTGEMVGWGDSTMTSLIPSGSDFVAISAGPTHALALRADGSVAAWGSNSDNQSIPPLGNDFIAVAAGDSFSLALRATSSSCPMVALSQLPGFEFPLDEFREFRDVFLTQSDAGRRLLALYRNHGFRLTRVVVRDPMLATRSVRLLVELAPAVRDAIRRDGKLKISREVYVRGLVLLDDVASCSPSDLRPAARLAKSAVYASASTSETGEIVIDFQERVGDGELPRVVAR